MWIVQVIQYKNGLHSTKEFRSPYRVACLEFLGHTYFDLGDTVRTVNLFFNYPKFSKGNYHVESNCDNLDSN